MKDKLPCCGYEVETGMFGPVFWNPYNGWVQCHNCGTIYEIMTMKKERREFNSVGYPMLPPKPTLCEVAQRFEDMAISEQLQQWGHHRDAREWAATCSA